MVLLRVLDILLLRKLKVRMTLYFSDSVFAGMLYLSSSSSSILRWQKQTVKNLLLLLLLQARKVDNVSKSHCSLEFFSC